VVDAIGAVRAQLPKLDALPLPGKGSTRTRWRTLAEIARADLAQGRLAEGHVDARAVLTELGRPDLCVDGDMLGVWAAEPQNLHATAQRGGWRLHGAKGWCSGSVTLDYALVTATAPDGPRLFVVGTQGLEPFEGSWQPLGMKATQSDTLSFDNVLVADHQAIGPPSAYVERAGFGHGGCGVAACWWGGALGVLDGLHAAVSLDRADPDELGLAAANLAAAGHALGAAADAIDERPEDVQLANRLAREVRLAVATSARNALDRAVDAMGASGLCHRPAHSTRVADLLVYLSQHRERSTATTHGNALLASPLSLPW